MVFDLVSHLTRSYFDHVRQLNGLKDTRLSHLNVEMMTTPLIVYIHFKETSPTKNG